jgi:predicted ester cyclase
MAALLTDDAVEEHLDIFKAEGARQVTGMNKGLWRTYPDLRADNCRVLAAGDNFVVFRATVKGTQDGPLEIPGNVSYPPSGNKVTGEMLGFVELQGDKISRITAGYNAAHVFAQVQGQAK